MNNNTNSTRVEDEASVVPLILLIIFLTAGSMVVTHYLLWHFARLDTPVVMKVLVGTTWFLGFEGVLVLLPADLVSGFYGVGSDFVAICWKIVYWSTFALAWIICPIAQEYHAAGSFTFKDKLLEAIKVNLKIYVLIGLIFVVFGAALVLTRGLTPAFVIAAANVYGLLLIIVMLGYGLVEVPSTFFRAADPFKALQSHEFRAGSVETRMIDAEDQVDETVEQLVAFRRKLNRGTDDKLIKYCDQVLELAPRREGSLSRSPRSGAASIPVIDTAATANPPTLYTLTNLHRKLKFALVAAERARWDWDDLLEKTAYLQKLLHDRRRIDPTHAAVVFGEDTPEGPPTEEEEENEILLEETAWKKIRRHVRLICYNFRVRWYTHIYRLGGLIFASASLVLLWCVVVSPFYLDLSLFGLIINQAETMLSVFLFSFFPLFYMSVCAYTALFKFKYLDVLSLHGNHQTDAYNLLYNASYMGRLQFSLGVVYFQMLYRQDSMDTAFHHLVGDMDTVPFLGKNFNLYSPFFILFFSVSSLLNCGDRVLDFLGISTHRRPRRGNREHEERIEEGRRLIANARARRERERRRTALNPPPNQNTMSIAAGRDGGYARVEDLLDRL